MVVTDKVLPIKKIENLYFTYNLFHCILKIKKNMGYMVEVLLC